MIGGMASDIVGEWSCVSAVIDGNPLDEKVAAMLTLKMTAERYRTERDGVVLFDSSYTLDESREPKRIEMIGTEGEFAGKVAMGIYAIEGEIMKMCYTMPGGERPGEFESVAGSGRFMIVWKRIKDSLTRG
jgi:uncharacterized protein (TIGR03067 family)